MGEDQHGIAKLGGRRRADLEAALREAVSSPDETALVRLLEGRLPYHSLIAAAALGDRRRPGPGDEALRAALRQSGPQLQDFRCAALVSLAKRCGAAATDDFLYAMRHRDHIVKGYALMCLDAFGDDQAWEDVLGWIKKRRSPHKASDGAGRQQTRAAVDYLVRCAPQRSENQRNDLARVLRARWDVLAADGVTDRLQRLWPGVQPGGPRDPGDARRRCCATGPQAVRWSLRERRDPARVADSRHVAT